MTGNTTRTPRKQLSPRRNNAHFRDKASWIAGSCLTNFQSITVVEDKLIVLGEELFIEYARDYMFPTTTWCIAGYNSRNKV